MPLTGIGAAERVQRVWLHPGPQLSVFVSFRLTLLILSIRFVRSFYVLTVVVLRLFSAQSLFYRDNRSFHARMHTQLAQDGLDVEFDGSIRDSERTRYHLVTLSFGDVA